MAFFWLLLLLHKLCEMFSGCKNGKKKKEIGHKNTHISLMCCCYKWGEKGSIAYMCERDEHQKGPKEVHDQIGYVQLV